MIRPAYCYLMVAVLVTVGASALAAPVYVWTDAAGVRHYSDRAASPAARRADQSIRALAEPADSPATTSAATPPGASHTPRIATPGPGARIVDPRGEATISLMIPDGLGPDERLIYRLDGRVLEDAPPRATRLAVDRLVPGRHELDVELVAHDTPTGRTDHVVFEMALGAGSAAGPTSTPAPGERAGRPPS
ncbi:hypothetical protein SAJA_03770 [Salinisphaera japonica YTM-1]|uniref:DUF4124 domain-containing protein n=2 Tax=Salinisphaera TaxID=180541 RepID=A0A423PZE5_9GAMM|nr:hypothetical protein SAJA_03770 [Salinisphaera japonica YTM-1]